MAPSFSSHALPPAEFHLGPYMILGGGTVQFAQDDNVRTGTQVGRNFEPALGFHFGWNVKDYLAPELQLRYSTNERSDHREHLVFVNLNLKYYLVLDALTTDYLDSFHILPFGQVGIINELGAIPGDPQASDDTMFMWAPGLSIGTGVMFLAKRYLYFGFLLQGDLAHYPNQYQDIGGTRQKVMDGGWGGHFGAMGLAGVHF